MTEHATPAHGERAHAILSASGAKIWLTCTPSARLQEKFPDMETEFSKEGTLAHELAEMALLQYRDGTEYPKDFDPSRYTKEMFDAAREYLDVIKGIVEPLRAAGEIVVILVEVKLDYSRWAPEGFGTSDCLILTKRKAWSIDFKYGKGVRVDVTEEDQSADPDADTDFDEDEDGEPAEVTNEQLRLYALGGLEEMSFVFDSIEEFELIIVQPRMNNIARGTVAISDLNGWADNFVAPRAKLAWAGEGEFVVGDHCGFCKARNRCRARAEYMQALLFKVGGLQDPGLLSPEEIAELLPQLPAIAKWATGMKAWARQAAIDAGVKFPGHKLVEGRSNRYITDPEAAIKRLEARGFPEDQVVKPKKMVGITALEKIVGKKELPILLGDLIAKPKGKPTLVPESDKRPVWVPAPSADEEFSD